MEEYERLRQRFIAGEINVDEYERRLRALRRPLTQDDVERSAAARSRPAVGAFAVTPRRGSTASQTGVPRAAKRRRVRWYVPVVGGCLMTIAALCGLGAAVGGIVGAFNDHDVNDDYMAEAFTASSLTEFVVTDQPTIRIHSEDDNVTVAAGDPGLVRVTTEGRDSEPWGAPFSAEQDGNTIFIDSDGDGGPFRSSPGGRGGDLVVTVPPASVLDIEVEAGNVDVSKVQGEIVTEVYQGNISIDAATLSGDSSLQVDNGSIVIDGALAPETELDISVNNGNAQFVLPRDTDARVKADVNSGNITTGGFPIEVSDDPDDAGAEASGDLTTDPTGNVEIDIDQGNITLSPRQ